MCDLYQIDLKQISEIVMIESDSKKHYIKDHCL